MAINSKIEWTDHTFNPWWDCTKISPACDNCYAEAWAKRVGSQVWGAKSPRRFFSDKHWAEPLKWNRRAAEQKTRFRVFCASMSDVFENRKELNVWRNRLWDLILKTPNLDWLLLTKRPSLISRYVPWGDSWPENVWLGTTVESQKWAEKRVPELIKHPAQVRFLSCEPLLGSLNLHDWLRSLHWIIAGGESGAHARPMNPKWVRELRDQCKQADVPFHFKQWGHWAPAIPKDKAKAVEIKDNDGGKIAMIPAGKKKAGRTLDGRVWDELPA